MQAQEINFPAPSPTTHHTCNSRREGDWIIFTCNECPDYMRRLNWKTGQMKTRDSVSNALHTGTHLPIGVDPTWSPS